MHPDVCGIVTITFFFGERRVYGHVDIDEVAFF